MLVSGFNVRMRPAQRFITVEDYRRAARRKLPDFVWAYLDGGAEDLVTLRENRTGFSAWSLRSRVLTAHGKRDLSTSVAGMDLSLPGDDRAYRLHRPRQLARRRRFGPRSRGGGHAHGGQHGLLLVDRGDRPSRRQGSRLPALPARGRPHGKADASGLGRRLPRAVRHRGRAGRGAARGREADGHVHAALDDAARAWQTSRGTRSGPTGRYATSGSRDAAWCAAAPWAQPRNRCRSRRATWCNPP